MCIVTVISIHAPAWGATLRTLTASPLMRAFQSTLPRGERHFWAPAFCIGTLISIHAPAWGATRSNKAKRWLSDYFNPRSRVGSDGGEEDKMPKTYISIHAPAWGATLFSLWQSGILCHFNPRSRVGSDGLSMTLSVDLNVFQSTLPRGERPSARSARQIDAWYFNPRSRVGSDSLFQPP